MLEQKTGRHGNQNEEKYDSSRNREGGKAVLVILY
jgi:hypothetical protein